MSLEQTDAVEDIAKCTLITLGILVELTVVCADLDLFRHNWLSALSLLSLVYVLFESATTANIWDLWLGHSLTFFRDEHLQGCQVSFFFNLFLCLFFLSLNASLYSLDVALEPPFFFEFSKFLFPDGLLAGWSDLLLLLLGLHLSTIHLVRILNILLTIRFRFTIVRVGVDRIDRERFRAIKSIQIPVLAEALQLREVVDIWYSILRQNLLLLDTDLIQSCLINPLILVHKLGFFINFLLDGILLPCHNVYRGLLALFILLHNRGIFSLSSGYLALRWAFRPSHCVSIFVCMRIWLCLSVSFLLLLVLLLLGKTSRFLPLLLCILLSLQLALSGCGFLQLFLLFVFCLLLFQFLLGCGGCLSPKLLQLLLFLCYSYLSFLLFNQSLHLGLLHFTSGCRIHRSLADKIILSSRCTGSIAEVRRRVGTLSVLL